MRENVVEELQRLEANDETKQKMVDILRRFHSEEEADDLNEEGNVNKSHVSLVTAEVFHKSIPYFAGSV